MNCAEVQRVLPELIGGVQDGEFQAHLNSCPACSELVSDLELIVREAGQLAASEEPPPRVWARIAAELRAEGLIREPETQPTRPVVVRQPRARWNVWWLVPVAAAVIAVGAYLVKPRPVGEIVQAPPAVTPSQAANPKSQTASASAEDEQLLDELSQRAPMMRASYENELRSVNSYIQDARTYAEQHPADEDARRNLMDAYQQKAMFYQMALNNIQ